MALAVRQDTQVDFGADGDYVPLSIDADGALRVTGGGGGTQYTTGANQTTPTGTVALGHDGASVIALAVDNSGQLQIDVVGGGLVDDTGTIMARLALLDEMATSLATLDNVVAGNEAQVDVVAALPTGSNVIGQITANAGTNLNTSALALETTATDIARFVSLVELSDTIVAGAVVGGEMVVAQSTAASLNAQVTQSGSWTVAANAGTNLNTSALALETTTTDIARFVALVELADTVVAGAVVGGEMTVAQGTAGSLNAQVIVGGEAIVGQGTASSLNAQVVGNIAHDLGVSGNPLQIAGEARSSERTAVASADVSRLITDLAGKLIVLPYANPELILSGTAETDTASAETIIAAQGASTRIFVTSLIISNASATNTEVNIQEGGSTTLARFPAPTVGGAVHGFLTPLRLAVNTALTFSSVSAVATMSVSAVGYSGA